MRFGIGGGGRIIRGGASIGRGGVRGGVGVGPFSLSGGTRRRRSGGGGGGGGGDGDDLAGFGRLLLGVVALLLAYKIGSRIAGRVVLPALALLALWSFRKLMLRVTTTRRQAICVLIASVPVTFGLLRLLDGVASYCRGRLLSAARSSDEAYEFFNSFVVGATWARWVLLASAPVVLTTVVRRWRYPTDEEGTAKGWMRDPTGRHQHRYWNGHHWTSHVADRGVASTDDYRWWRVHRRKT